MLLYTQEHLTSEIRRSRENGFRVEIHVIGDRAAEAAIKALEDGLNNMLLVHLPWS